MRVLPLALCLLAAGARLSVAQDPSDGSEPPRRRPAPGAKAADATEPTAEPTADPTSDPTDEQILAALERRTHELRAGVTPAIVSITVTTEAYPLPRYVLPGLTIGPPEAVAEEREGTGVVLTKSGSIVTSLALVENAASVRVTFHDGETVTAGVIGFDPPFGIAVIQATPPQGARTLSAVNVADNAGPQLAWLFGPLGADGTPTVQQQAVRRLPVPDDGYDRYLAGPMTLLPGGAGGALVNRHGELIGLAISSRRAPRRGGNSLTPEGTTLFVSADDVAHAVKEIVASGRVRRGMLGVLLRDESNRIDQLIPGGPGEKAGFLEGDRILRIADETMETAGDVTRALLRKRPGEVVRVEIVRDGTSVSRSIELEHTGYPPAPLTPPLVGATLQISGSLGANGTVDRAVTFSDVDAELPLHAAGVRAGDALVSVDGRPALQFLARYRIRPERRLPSELVVLRAGRTLTIRLPD